MEGACDGMPPWDSQPRSAAWFCPSIETLFRHQRKMRRQRDACGVNKPNSCGEAPARQRRPAWRYHPCVCVYLSAHVCLEELVPSHSARAQAARHARHCQLPVHQPGLYLSRCFERQTKRECHGLPAERASAIHPPFAVAISYVHQHVSLRARIWVPPGKSDTGRMTRARPDRDVQRGHSMCSCLPQTCTDGDRHNIHTDTHTSMPTLRRRGADTKTHRSRTSMAPNSKGSKSTSSSPNGEGSVDEPALSSPPLPKGRRNLSTKPPALLTRPSTVRLRPLPP